MYVGYRRGFSRIYELATHLLLLDFAFFSLFSDIIDVTFPQSSFLPLSLGFIEFFCSIFAVFLWDIDVMWWCHHFLLHFFYHFPILIPIPLGNSISTLQFISCHCMYMFAEYSKVNGWRFFFHSKGITKSKNNFWS